MAVEIATEADNKALEACRGILQNRIESGEISLPVLPEVAGRVVELTNQADADIGELSTLIHQDQALAGHVLRIANSALYGSSVTIVSLQQAVTRLGTRLLGEIAIAVSLQSDVFAVTAYHDIVRDLWRHSLASGVYGKEVARVRRSNVEGQFLCGLLHGVGKPVVLQLIVEAIDSCNFNLTRDQIISLMDELHSSIGEKLCLEWNLPEMVRITCVYYRDYSNAPDYGEQVAMTYLSDRLAMWLIDPKLSEEALQNDPVFAALNLYPDEVESLLSKRDEVVETVSALAI